MQLIWLLTVVSLYLQLGLTKTIQNIENNHNSDNDKTVAVPLKLVYGGFHYAEIGIGTPPQPFKIFFDTWNQNTWVTSTKCPDTYAMCKNHAKYDAGKSSSKNETTEPFSYVEYGTTVSGTITEDKVTLGGQTVIQPFGEANATDGETLDSVTFDGSFGIGFGSTGTGQPTIVESLAESHLIDKQVFGMYTKSNGNGEIMFGGYNEKLYSGELDFTGVISPQEWLFGVKSIKFGNEDLTGDECKGIVNDGSHHIYGPQEQVEKIYKVLDCKPADLCEVDCKKIKTFPKLKITVSKTEFTIGPEDYIDKEGDKCTGRIFHLNHPSWMLGNLFLDKVYTAYDTENVQIGFALAKLPLSTLSPTPRSTTTPGPTTTTTGPTTTTTPGPTTTTRGPTTTTTTQEPQPSTTSAASTLFSHRKSMELVMIIAVLGYLQM